MIQLDLFGEVAATEHQRIVDALTCLRDAVPEALQIVVELQHHQARDTRSPRVSGNWAYCASAEGLRFENADEWWNTARHRGETWGWSRTPARLLSWADLADLIGHDQRRADLATWAVTLPRPRWQILLRPKELWPDPDSWHPSHIHRDHASPHWPARRRAWQLVLDLLDDAIEAISPSTTNSHPSEDASPSCTARDAALLPAPCWWIDSGDPEVRITHYPTRTAAEYDHTEKVREDYGLVLTTTGAFALVPGIVRQEPRRCYEVTCPECGLDQHIQNRVENCADECGHQIVSPAIALDDPAQDRFFDVLPTHDLEDESLSRVVLFDI